MDISDPRLAAHQATIDAFEKAFSSPAAERNRRAIAAALTDRLPAAGTVVEIACGALQHALTLASEHPTLTWLPTDIDPRILPHASDYLAALAACGRRPLNLQDPIFLDAAVMAWPVPQATVVYSANLLHISPGETMTGLCRGAAETLLPGGQLLIYGPFRRKGRFTSRSDARFDASLRERNAAWGIRDLEKLNSIANDQGLTALEPQPMPANNWLLEYRRTGEIMTAFRQEKGAAPGRGERTGRQEA